jgi:hypothetical protein
MAEGKIFLKITLMAVVGVMDIFFELYGSREVIPYINPFVSCNITGGGKMWFGRQLTGHVVPIEFLARLG